MLGLSFSKPEKCQLDSNESNSPYGIENAVNDFCKRIFYSIVSNASHGFVQIESSWLFVLLIEWKIHSTKWRCNVTDALFRYNNSVYAVFYFIVLFLFFLLVVLLFSPTRGETRSIFYQKLWLPKINSKENSIQSQGNVHLCIKSGGRFDAFFFFYYYG